MKFEAEQEKRRGETAAQGSADLGCALHVGETHKARETEGGPIFALNISFIISFKQISSPFHFIFHFRQRRSWTYVKV